MQMLSIKELKSLKEISWKRPLKLVLINNGKRETFLKFEQFCNCLIEATPHLRLEYGKERLIGLPALKLDNVNIYYLSLPLGEHWQPFLSAIRAMASKNIEIGEDDLEALKDINSPIEIKVMIKKACPLCPIAANLANQAAIANMLIRTYIIDVEVYPRIKRGYQVTATPTVIIDEDYILVERQVRDVIKWAVKASKKIYDSEVLRSLLKEARAQRVVQLCLERGKIPNSLLNLLLDIELSSRVGTMVVLEEISKEAPNIVQNTIPKLLSMLKLPNKRDRGDVLYILGLIGTPEIIPILRDIASKETEELEEIALEAIENIKKRHILH